MEETYVAQTETSLSQQPVLEQPKKSPLKWIFLASFIILFLIVGTGTYFLSQKSATKTTELPLQNTSKTKGKTTIPTPTTSSTDSSKDQNDKSNWITYISSDGSFSFKYPSDGNWKVPINSQASIQCLKNCPKSYNIFNFTVKKSDKTDIQKYISSLNTTNPKVNTPTTPYILDYELIKINGIDAVKTLNPSPPNSGTGPVVSVFIVIDEVGYLYQYTYLDPNLNSATKLDQLPPPNPDILSTIKFGDQTSTSADATSSWNTYTNTIQGVTFKYPPNWFIKNESDNNTCSMLSDSSDFSPPYAHTIISLCTYPEPISNDSNNKQITVNGNKGIQVQQTSNWGISQKVFFQNPKGGSTEIGNLIGDVNIFNLILTTFKFID